MNRKATRVFLRWRGLNADTGSSIESISDVHLHKVDSSSSTFLLRPFSPSPSHSLASCSVPCQRLLPSTSAIWKHFHFLFSPPFYLGSARVLACFAFIRPSTSLHCTFQPYPLAPLASFVHTAYLPFMFLRGTRECLLCARISLLNLVLQVTILLLSPFSPWYFSCRYSTLLLFLVNTFVFVTERTSGTSPLFFCIR